MQRRTGIVASTLAIAALGVAGAQTGAHASVFAATCTHGIVAPFAGHPNGVEYVGFRTGPAGAHIHRYKHRVPVFVHYSENVC